MIEITGLADIKSSLNLHTTPTHSLSFLYNLNPHGPPFHSSTTPLLFIIIIIIPFLFSLSLSTAPQSHSLLTQFLHRLNFIKLEMMVQKEDLGLSLSLNFRHNIPNPQHLSLISSSTHSSSPSASNPFKPSWNDAFASSDRNSDTCRGETRSFLRGIDVNRLPSAVDMEEEAGVSSPNSTVSSVSGKRSEREPTGEEHDMNRACSRGISDEEDGETSRKKLRLSKDQSAILEESFKEHNTLNPKQKLALAKQLGLLPRQVEVWFQNRRARTKLKQTEVDCEVLKRCCENLTEENRRLQKEVQELRALKLSPQFYMQMTPPTTLTMCPSCERVAVPSSAVDAATRHHPMGQAQSHSRALGMGPWGSAASIPQRGFDGFHH